MRILLVEDDRMIGKAMWLGLGARGFTVDWLSDGRAALHALEDPDFEAVVLDLGLPHVDGISVLQSVRKRGADVPILVVTARDALEDKLAAFNGGADDYVVKPFELDELAARLNALVRRRFRSPVPVLRHGRLAMDLSRREVTLDDELIGVSPKEFAILQALLKEPGAVLSIPDLERAVYPWDEGVASNAIEVHLYKLRRKLGSDAICNVRGMGYRIGDFL